MKKNEISLTLPLSRNYIRIFFWIATFIIFLYPAYICFSKLIKIELPNFGLVYLTVFMITIPVILEIFLFIAIIKMTFVKQKFNCTISKLSYSKSIFNITIRRKEYNAIYIKRFYVDKLISSYEGSSFISYQIVVVYRNRKEKIGFQQNKKDALYCANELNNFYNIPPCLA